MQSSSSTVKYTCECGKSFNRKYHRDRHCATVHRIVAPMYKCTVFGCNCGFAFPNELSKHEKTVHCNDYKCGLCQRDFKTKQCWERHQWRWHKTYAEKVIHSLPPQPEGENYLWKIYLLVHESGNYYKIGCTKKPILAKLAALKSKHCKIMIYSKSWNLSEKFTEHWVETLENELHEYMRSFGFVNVDDKREYFYFQNRELEETFIQDCIEMIVKEYEQQDFIAEKDFVTSEHVKNENKRKYVPPSENPTENQLKERKRCKKWRDNNRGNYIYFFSNGINVGKIGQTIRTPLQRLSNCNYVSTHGKFEPIMQWSLGDDYNPETKRKYVEDKIIHKMGQQFSRIIGTREHFKILPSENMKAIEIIDKIIKDILHE